MARNRKPSPGKDYPDTENNADVELTEVLGGDVQTDVLSTEQNILIPQKCLHYILMLRKFALYILGSQKCAQCILNLQNFALHILMSSKCGRIVHVLCKFSKRNMLF